MVYMTVFWTLKEIKYQHQNSIYDKNVFNIGILHEFILPVFLMFNS